MNLKKSILGFIDFSYRSLQVWSRVSLLGIIYSIIITLSLTLAVLFRFDWKVPQIEWENLGYVLFWMLPLKLFVLAIMGQFRVLLTYFSYPDIKRIGLVVIISALISLALWYVMKGSGMPPRGVLLTDMMISFIGLAGFRSILRSYRENAANLFEIKARNIKRVAILGAGSSGSALHRDILSRPSLNMKVVCFIDDNMNKIGSTLHGVCVLGPTNRLCEFINELGVNKVIIANQEVKPALIKALVTQINSMGIDHDILPSVSQILNRQVTVNLLRHVEPEDLLGRDAVPLDHDGIKDLISMKVVLITGAGGSIGSELSRQVAGMNPAKLVLIERSEAALFNIEQELLGSHRHVETVPCASSVCDEEAMERIMVKHRPVIVFHAAAHKHVPLMEQQPIEALQNNTMGTEVMACLSCKMGVRKFVLVSTDKAVNPTNVMGATKRLAEMLIDEKQKKSSGCAYAAVRFGNVLGSSGSVVPTFREQIARGGPLTVTHPEVTRFFMSIPEAVGLILQCTLQAQGGEIFVLDMGEPLKITDLARQMIELSGFIPDEDIKISFTGLRPGEKLYEEPIHQMENVEVTIHPKVRILRSNRSNTTGLTKELREFIQENGVDDMSVKQWLKSKIPEYQLPVI
jgi:FlaA1/EpsC-like NDP-sugar epimerase